MVLRVVNVPILPPLMVLRVVNVPILLLSWSSGW